MIDLQVTLPEDNEVKEPTGLLKSPRHVGSAGRYRYLKPQELDSSNPYDYAVICHRRYAISSHPDHNCRCNSF